MDTQCWLWAGTIDTNGYGRIWAYGRLLMAHRFVYEHLVGKVPSELVIDHLCRVRQCINPKHLEPVTNAVNLARGIGKKGQYKTHCVNGHEFSPENTSWDKRGWQRCKKCRHESYLRAKP